MAKTQTCDTLKHRFRDFSLYKMFALHLAYIGGEKHLCGGYNAVLRLTVHACVV